MEVICINGKFSPDQLAFWARYKVVHPEQDKMYSVRDVIINSSGQNGLLLEEIHNPKIPIKHPLLGVADMEPNWDINRFRTLSMDNIQVAELKKLLKENYVKY